jgi:hypothetical protein
MTADDHTERILRAAVAFVRAMHLPADHETRLAEWEQQQTAALARLVAAVIARHSPVMRRYYAWSEQRRRSTGQTAP